MKSPVLGSLATVLLIGLSALAPFMTEAAVVISDQTFSPGSWTTTVAGATGGATQSSGQATSGGNSGSYWRMSHTLPGESSIAVWHLYTALTYVPSTQGAIASIDYSEDRIELDPPFAGAGIGARFLLQQGGGTWVSNSSLTFTNLAWDTASLTGLVASSFGGVSGTTGSPDFSSSGAPITFGILRSNTIHGSTTYTTTNGLDNWTVTIHQVAPVPLPAAAWLLLSGLAGVGFVARRRTSV